MFMIQSGDYMHEVDVSFIQFKRGIGPSEVRAPAVGVAHADGERSGLY